MKLIFIDEFKSRGNSNLFGVVLIFVDSNKYNLINKLFLERLDESGWDKDEEFKGKYLFSRNAAEQRKTPSEMIDLTKGIIGGLSSRKSSSRGKVYYSYNNKGQTIDNYCYLITKILKKLPNARSQKSGKHLTSVYFDYFNSCAKPLESKQIDEKVGEALESKKYLLVERHCIPIRSSNYSAGVIYADVCANLGRWICENPRKEQCCLSDIIEHTERDKINIVHDIKDRIKYMIKV